MKDRSHLIFGVLLSFIVSTALACSLVTPRSASTPAPIATAASTDASLPEPTSESTAALTPPPPQVVTRVVTVVAATVTGPACTVQQDLNFRFGPGTAYDPPLYQLHLNDVVVPVGYKAQGTPGGSWVMVEDPDTNQQGWVSAGSQYVSCNVDVTTLPNVAVAPPPLANFPDSALSSIPDGKGFCVDPKSGLKCVVTFSEQFLIQFQLIRNGRELNQNNGVNQVSFRVETLDGDLIYKNVEGAGAYCIFGGNGPCNNWFVNNGVYRWSQGGERVRPGEYHVEIEITYRGDTSLWMADFIVTLP